MKKQFYRVKQLADQTFSSNKSGRSETLTDELQSADRKVEVLRSALQAICKRFIPLQGQDQTAREKRLRKLPEYLLGLSMCEASSFDEDDSVLKHILHECGIMEKSLASEIAEHELKVEQLVCTPLNNINENDLPQIVKTKKQLSRLISEKDSAHSRYHYLLKQMETNPSKLNAVKEELEEAALKVEQCRDALAAEMFSLVSKEAQLAHTLLQYVKLQRAYHESALHSLQGVVPALEEYINARSLKPMFGFPLEDHLKMNGRAVAFPIELCVCVLSEVGLSEEGLFRVAGGSSKVRRMKLSLDSGLFSLPLQTEYRDPHVVASVLKSYLRELPEPLLTHKLRSNFVDAARLPPATRLLALQETVKKLPEQNHRNLRYLVSFLAVLTKNRGRNRMTPTNLAIVLAPNLLWSCDDSFDMSTTGAANIAVEMLIENAEKFFDLETDFFLTFTKEDLMPDLCDGGFSVLASGEPVTRAGRHSRSNSHDANVILLDNNVKKAQSNSSLSDQSSPPHGSPKPVIRKKTKPLAPIPPVPVFNEKTKSSFEIEKPNKPPRPAFNDVSKVTSGTQTIDRIVAKRHNHTNKNNQLSKDDNATINLRRRSLEEEIPKNSNDFPAKNDDMAKSMFVPDLVQASSEIESIENGNELSNLSLTIPESDSELNISNQSVKDQDTSEPDLNKSDSDIILRTPKAGRPVAAPRLSIQKPESDEVKKPESTPLKPVVPERPAALRPHSFRGPLHSDSDSEGKPRVQQKVIHPVQIPSVLDSENKPQKPVETDCQAAVKLEPLPPKEVPQDNESHVTTQPRSKLPSDNEVESRPRPVRPAVPPPPIPTSTAESTDL